MDTTTQAQLYLADQRGCSQTDFFRSFHLFNSGFYVAAGREPVGPLRTLNDNSLQAGHTVTKQVDQNTAVLILPITGGLAYESSHGSGFLEAGQAQLFSFSGGMTYTISNPYDTELINYLEIWLTDTSETFRPAISPIHFNWQTANTLIPLFSLRTGQGFIGRYAGRAEGIYPVTDTSNAVFVYVLSGIFEVQDRLMHERDGLTLTAIDTGEMAFEALSNDAVLLLLDVSLHTV